MLKNIDKSYFPGWVRKAVTFTIDDGDIVNDKKFLDIVRPARILGTFNICGVDKMTAEEYRRLYAGYEIANHVKLHPELFVPGVDYKFSGVPFCKETADKATLYPHETKEGVWYVNGSYYGVSSERWFRITDCDTYIRLIDEAKVELEAVFGEGSVKSFVWPFGQQKDHVKITEYVEKAGYYGARNAGRPLDNFNLPENRMDWRYSACDSDLLAKMEQFEALPDDGKLKFFSFGVHSIDYERSGRWGELAEFAKRYGCRTEEFYYATVGDIFEYEDAINSLVITDNEIYNSSDKTLYLKINGEKTTLAPNKRLEI